MCEHGFIGACAECDGSGQIPETDAHEYCRDCGAEGERTGHQACQYPQDHD